MSNLCVFSETSERVTDESLIGQHSVLDVCVGVCCQNTPNQLSRLLHCPLLAGCRISWFAYL